MEYKNKILFGRLSKAGKHLNIFQHDDILAPGVNSLLVNVAELQAVIDGKADYVKVSAMKVNKDE